MPGKEIIIRSYPGENAVIDSGITDFRITGKSCWIPAQTVDPAAHPNEWVSKQTFPKDIRPSRGAFLNMPYHRLVTYATLQDFRAECQTFDKIFDVEPYDAKRGPYKVTDANFVPLLDNGREFTVPWVYMGPGLFLFHDGINQTNRVHVRLSHTKLNIPGLEDYLGPTDPNQVALVVGVENIETLIILNSKSL